MMNAELVRADQSRIIVPTVFREDYILALRKLTRHKDPLAYINVMTKLHQFSDNLYGTDFTELKDERMHFANHEHHEYRTGKRIGKCCIILEALRERTLYKLIIHKLRHTDETSSVQ